MVFLAALTLPLFAQFGGPSILSRGDVPTGMVGADMSLKPYGDISGVYNTGLAAVASNDGGLANAEGYGVEAGFGLTGVRQWRHTRLGIDYRGSFRQYNRTAYYDGGNQSLLFGINHRLTRHATLIVQETLSLMSRPTGLPGLSITVPFDPAATYAPNTNFFDNRTFYGITRADLLLQKSARLSFNVGASEFFTRRRSTALYGVTGATAHGDVQYRISRRITTGANYTYTHFSYGTIFSSTDFHTFNGSFAMQISRRLEFSGYGGVGRNETKFIQTVAIDPLIANLLGVTTRSQIRHSIDWIPNVNGRLTRTFHNGVAFASGGHTVTPGNGLFLTSFTSNVIGGYTYTGFRKSSLTGQVQYSSAGSIGNIVGNYGDFGGGLSVTRRLRHSVSALVDVSARQYNSPSFANYNRTTYLVRVGLRFSPGEVPLRVW